MDPRAGGPVCRGSLAFFARMRAQFLRWTAHQLWLAAPVGGRGVSRASALLQIEKATGKKRPEFSEGQRPPSSLAHLWEWFLLLAGNYAQTGIVPGPATLKADLAALTGMTAHAWEIRLIGEMFSLWRDENNSNRRITDANRSRPAGY